MGKTKYQIFISSTYTDLKRERSAVTDVIIHMGHFPVGMESFGASSRDQWDIIKEMMDESDYIVLIIGYRYGTEIKDGEFAGISYTEREFKYAKEHNIPVLAFIEERRNVPDSKKESDPLRLEKLEKFKSDVKYQRTVEFWASATKLREKVQDSLNKEFERTKRPGWIRAECQNSEDTSSFYDIVNELELMHEAMTVSDLMEETGLSEQVVQNILDQLVDDERVEKINIDGYEKYQIPDPYAPTDGYHVFRNRAKTILKEGIWKNEKLYDGKEYNWIIKDENHNLVYNPETNDYDGDANTEITEYAQYDEDSFSIYWMDSELEYEGLEHYYVADIIASNGTYEYVNIRKLEDWLEDKEPQWLKSYRKYYVE